MKTFKTLILVLLLCAAQYSLHAYQNKPFYEDIDAPPEKIIKSLWFDLNTISSPISMKYSMNFVYRFVSIGFMEKLSGHKVFLSGPHGNDRIVSTSKEFGYYNHEFIKWVKDNMIPAENDKEFRSKTQRIYDLKIKEFVRELVLNYHFLKTKHKDVLLTVAETAEPRNQLCGKYRCDLVSEFWFRRTIDGTASDMNDLFLKLLKIYDPEFIKERLSE